MSVPGTEAGEAPQPAIMHQANSKDEQRRLGNDITRHSSPSVPTTSRQTVRSGFRETLCNAVAENDEKSVRRLLQLGANPETPGDAGNKPLYIATENGFLEIMELLLSYGASVESQTSATHSTALIRACEEGYEAAVQLLIEAGADIEARRHDGYTPLFISVASANEKLVKYLLQHGADKRRKLPDGTAMTDCAQGNDSLLALLKANQLLEGPQIGSEQRSSKWQFKVVRPPAEPDDHGKLSAVQSMQATVVAFFVGRHEQRSPPISVSVYDLLYGNGPDAVSRTYGTHANQDGSAPVFTWYHLPANNTVWVNDLITRLLADRKKGAAMLDDRFRYNIGLKNVVNGHGKRDYRSTFTFMRPSWKPFETDSSMSWKDNTLDEGAAFIPFLSSELFHDYEKMYTLLNTAKNNAAALVESSSRAASPQVLEGRQSLPAGMSQAMKHRKGPQRVTEWLVSGSAPAPGKRKAQDIRDVTQETGDALNPNELHVRGYGVLDPSGRVPFQPRFSLDQYYYSQLESTVARDKDQVIYRYTNDLHNSTEAKIFMVDQLWMWMINGDTLITCAPNQWRHGSSTRSRNERSSLNLNESEESLERGPVMESYEIPGRPINDPMRPSHPAQDPNRGTDAHNHENPRAWLEPNFLEDPLSVHQKVLRHLRQTARKPISTLYDLAGLIVTCSASTFDETQIPDEYQFFNFFENSISIVNDKVTRSLHDFKQSLATRAAARKSNPGKSASIPERRHQELTAAENEELSITNEIDLVIETEDIKDELQILRTVLGSQRATMKQLEGFLVQARTKVGYINNDEDYSNLVDYSCIDIQIHRIEEMNALTNRALSSLHHLIDLKQKQASFFEMISSRELAWRTAENTKLQFEQGEETTRQGKTLMVFTVVTIIFLPLSFMAAFFAINVDAFDWNQDGRLELNYLLKYMLSIGFAIAIPFVGLAFSIEEIGPGVLKVFNMGQKVRRPNLGHGVAAFGQRLKPPARFIASGIITVTILMTSLVMILVWTSSLGTQSKLVVTVLFSMFFVLVFVGKGFRLLLPSSVGEESAILI